MAAVRGSSTGSRTLFVHAGLHPRLLDFDGAHSVAAANARAKELLFTQPGHELFVGHWSPLWTRFLAGPESQHLCNDFLPLALARFNVDRVVVGHTIQRGFTSGMRCGGRCERDGTPRVVHCTLRVTRPIYFPPIFYAHIRIILSDAGMSRWVREGGGSAETRAFALVLTLGNGGADVDRIEEVAWRKAQEAYSSVLLFDAEASQM
jgi:hypothetical protein